MDGNQQIVVEHIVNIDTTAQYIDSVNAVAGMAAQLVAVAGMLPDVAATAQARADIRALAKKLGAVTSVAEALPLLAGLETLAAQVTTVLGMRPELAAVTGQMDAIRRLAAEVDTLVQAPEHAAKAEAAAEQALAASLRAHDEVSAANTARLNAEFAEAEAKKAGAQAEAAKAGAETFSQDARKAADAAAAVSGLPDASLAVPGEPLIWNGAAFAVGRLADSLTSTEGVLGVSPAVLDTLSAAKETADSSALVAERAHAAAAEAKTTAEGVDAKATQARSDAAAAKGMAEAAGAKADTFAARMDTAEAETLNVGTALGAHAGNADIHTSKTALETFVVERVNTGLNQLKDGGDGSALPENRSTLLDLSGAVDTVSASLADFLDSAEPGQRLAILAELDRLAASAASGLTRGDVVNALTSDDAEAPLAAAQGKALAQQVATVKTQVEAATGRSWVGVVAQVPETWPENVHSDGLLLHCVMTDDSIVNPQWLVNTLNRPTPLVTNATGIRLADGTTVQSAVAQIRVDTAEAKENAATALAAAQGVDAKAEQAVSTAAAAEAKAAEALAKSPALATQTTPGIVKGSDTVDIGEDGSVNVVGGGAPLDSPAFTGTPTVPTVEDASDASQQIANTEFVQNAIVNNAFPESSAVVGVCLVQGGGGAGMWARINEQGEIMTVTGDYFTHHAIYSNIRPVLVDGQYMQQHNKFWVKTGIIAQGALSGKRAWWISPEAREGFVVHPAFMKNGIPRDNIWIGAYQATDEGGAKIGSNPGKLPIVNQDFKSLKTLCANRNTGGVQGFCMWNIYMLGLVQLLYLIEHLSSDSQAAIGRGRENGSTIAATDAVDVAQATWRGHVGLWGNIWQMVDGFRINSMKRIEIFNSAGNVSYVDTGVTHGENVIGQYAQSIYHDAGDAFDLSLVFFPKKLVGSINEATFPDKFDFNANAGTFVCYAGAPVRNGDGCGIFCKNMYYDENFSYYNTGTRIAKF